MSDRKCKNDGQQTGTDRNRQDYISDIENYCIIKKFIYQIGNPEVKENPNEKKQEGGIEYKTKKQFLG